MCDPEERFSIARFQERAISLRARRFAPALALLALAAAALVGCHKKNTIASLGATPVGTYNFTVTGTSQNSARSLPITLVVVQK